MASTTTTTAPTQGGYTDSSHYPTNYGASNLAGHSANYNYNASGYKYYQYTTQPTTQAQDVQANYPQSTYGSVPSASVNQPVYTQPSTTYQLPSSYNQAVDGQQSYNQAAGYSGNITQGGYTPITYTTAAYTQPTNPIYSQSQPTIQVGYVQPQLTTQANYIQPQPTNQSGYIQPQATTQANYAQPQLTTQPGYVQPQLTTQAGYVQPQPTTQTGYVQPYHTTQANYVPPTTQTPYMQPSLQNTASTSKSMEDILSERMAALMPKSKKQSDSNLYIPSQYPQYDYAQGGIQPNNYSYANTNMPTSHYSTMSNTNYPYVTTSEQSAVDAGNYNDANASMSTTAGYTYDYNAQAATYTTSRYRENFM